MKKIILIIMLISIVVLSLAGCTEKISNDATTGNKVDNTTTTNKVTQDKSTIANPDSIIFYNEGKKIIISETDVKYTNIVKLTKGSIKEIKGQYKSIFNVEDLKSKGTLLELDYTNKNTLEYTSSSGDKEIITYTKLYFDLNKNADVSLMSFEGDGHAPMGPLSSIDELIDILND